MITRMSIENFRGFERIELSGMSRVCLISGKNNVGKSTLLDALFLLMDHSSNDSFAKLNGFRGQQASDSTALWEPLFYDMDSNRQIRLSIDDDSRQSSLTYDKDTTYLPASDNSFPEDVLAQFRTATRGSYSLRFRFVDGEYEEQGHFFAAPNGVLRQMKTNQLGNEIRYLKPTRFLNASFSRSLEGVPDGIGRLELQDRKQVVISILKKLDPSIEDILTVSRLGITQLHVRTHDRWVPIQFAGDGVLRLLQVCLALLENENSLLLIDEIETGLHFSVYDSLWKAVEELSGQTGCQVIATTHSYEMIAAAQSSIADEDAFSYYRLGRAANGIAAYRYSHSMLGDALASEMEVR